MMDYIIFPILGAFLVVGIIALRMLRRKQLEGMFELASIVYQEGRDAGRREVD